MTRTFLIILFICSTQTLPAQKLFLGIGKKTTKTTFSAYDKSNIHESNSTLDLNFTFEIRSNRIVSFKTGIFFHSFDIGYGHWVYFNNLARQYQSYGYEAYFMDFPLLFVLNIQNKNRISVIQLNAGPCISHGFGGSVTRVLGKASGEEGFPNDFRKNNQGLMLSIGINIKKWQISGYYRTEFNNLVKVNNTTINNIHNSVTGLNLVRIINLSKKSSETKK